MTRETFINRIGEHADTLVGVVRNGVLSYPTQYNETLDVHTTRSQASLMHDHMIAEGKRSLPHPEFHWVKTRGRSLCNFHDCMLLQFKRLSHRMMPSNYPTHQAELIARMGSVDGLPGMDAVIPLITIGYVPRPFLDGIEGVFATYIENFRPVWAVRLDDAQEQELPAPPISILPPPPNPHVPRTRSRIRPPKSDPGRNTSGSA